MGLFEDGDTHELFKNAYADLKECKSISDAKDPSLQVTDGKSLFTFVGIFYAIAFVAICV